MSKIIEKSNFRVVVEPKGLGDYGGIRVSDSMFHKTKEAIEKGYFERCQEIVDDIKRHVDNAGYVNIEYDTEVKCSYCGYGWEIDPATNEPDCCQKAIDEFNNEKTKS
jgi:hypothetical protein